MSAREKLDEIKARWGLKTDVELAKKLEVGKITLDKWLVRDKIPDKIELKIRLMSHQDNKDNSTQKSDLINIPYYKDVSAAAGCGIMNHCAETEIIKMSKSFLTAMYGVVTFTGLEALNVAGESMAPQLSDGDIIIVLKNAPIVQGGIYVVVWHGEAMVKRVQRNPKTGAVRLISDNPICDSYTVEDDDLENLRIVGQVVAHMVRTK
jgi:phage repressor protein C with HTH and peptisase S24 domain